MRQRQAIMLAHPMKYTEESTCGPDADEVLDYRLASCVKFLKTVRVCFTAHTQWEDSIVIYHTDADGHIEQPPVHVFFNYALFGEHTWALLGADQHVMLDAGRYLFTAWTKDAPPYSPNRWRQICVRRRGECLEANDGSGGSAETRDDLIVTWGRTRESRFTSS